MERIRLGHGSGGRLMHALIDSLFMKELKNPVLSRKGDSAILSVGKKKLAFTTDSYVVDPLFFPGGDIGSLAVHGTVNDLSVCGARPLGISLGLVIEEGLPLKTLEKITRSIAAAAAAAGVAVVTGDTKVVGKGACDKIFIHTSGLGEVYYDGLSERRIKVRDSVIVSGPVGDHAISVLSKREGMAFSSTVRSDSAPLITLIAKVLRASKNVKIMRDPTRGGLATTLNEFTAGSRFGIVIDERRVPVREGVRQACELLGLDPLYLACEGRVVVVVAKEDECKVLAAMRADRHGRLARAIGTVTSQRPQKVCLATAAGGMRILDMLTGEQLPRIC